MIAAPVIAGRRTGRGLHRRWRRIVRRLTGYGFLAALAALAGMTDAIGFLAVGHFVSFMSGNTTQLAIALGGADLGTALLLGGTILAYVAGNAFGIVVMEWSGRRQSLLLALTSVLLSLGALLPGPDRSMPAIVAVVFAMGLVNAVVERVEGQPFGITYVTGALSRFGRGLGRWMVGDRSGVSWALELVPFGGMLAGATFGAAASLSHGRTAILLPAALAAGLALAVLAIPRRWRRRYHAPLARLPKPSVGAADGVSG